MSTVTHEIFPLLRVPEAWLLPLRSQQPTRVEFPHFIYTHLAGGLHKQNSDYCWSMYYIETGGKISIYVPPMEDIVHHSTSERVIRYSESLQADGNDPIRVLQTAFSPTDVRRIEELPPGLREIMFIRHHHPNRLVRDTIQSAVTYANLAGASANEQHMTQLLYSML